MENYDLALEDLNRAIELDSGYMRAYYMRGNVLGEGFGDDLSAVEDYSRAINLDPTFANAYYGRAFSYDILGQVENAIADYNTFVELATPGDPLITQARQRLQELES